MDTVVTICLSFLIFALIVWGFMHMRTPRFRMGRAQFLQGLEHVITGQADDNEWQLLTAYPMRHDPVLEQLREECLVIEEEEYTGGSPYLFSEAGIERLRALRLELVEKIEENE